MSRWIGVLALAAFACAACGGDASQTPAGPGSGPVAGSATQGARILGNVTAGQPLGAMAAQVVGTAISSPVNTSGGFSLDNVPAGAVQLRFVGSGIDASVGLNPVQPGDVVSVLVGVSGATATIQSESRNAGNKVELEGRVESLSTAAAVPLWLVVSGRKVTATPQTPIRDGNSAAKAFADLAIGQRVHVKGTLVTGPPSVVEAESILIQIAKSNAQFWTVSIASGRSQTVATMGSLRILAGRSQVLGDGPRQSGGRHIPILTLPGFETGLRQVADDLSSQYLITYVLPSGVRPSDRISVSLNKPGLTLRAPSRVPK